MKSRKTKTRKTNQPKPVDHRRPFIEHLQELRKRATHVVASIIFFATMAYFVQQKLVDLILRPAHGQNFIYTSPGGGIGFLFGLCTDVGIVLTLPLLIYEILGFLKPLVSHDTRHFVRYCVLISAALGAVGVAFGYFLGLPLALHFLGHQFTTKQITPLLTISEYMSFVTIYLAGSALLFQLPLILIIANHIKPIKPKRLLGLERWAIVIAFVSAMLMAPTINIIDQLIIAGPVIVAYQVGTIVVWLTNRQPKRLRYIAELLEHDRQIQAERLQRASEAQPSLPAASRRSQAITIQRSILVN